MKFIKGTYPYKYTAIFTIDGKEKRVSFGHQDYQQYKDSTPLKLYTSSDHRDKKRRERYRARHMKILNKNGVPSYKIKYTKAWFSWNYLW